MKSQNCYQLQIGHGLNIGTGCDLNECLIGKEICAHTFSLKNEDSTPTSSLPPYQDLLSSAINNLQISVQIPLSTMADRIISSPILTILPQALILSSIQASKSSLNIHICASTTRHGYYPLYGTWRHVYSVTLPLSTNYLDCHCCYTI